MTLRLEQQNISTSAGPTRAQWLVLLAAFLGWMFDGLEMGLFPLIARPALLDLLGVEGDKLVGLWMGRITALFLLGAAAGGLVFGWESDRWKASVEKGPSRPVREIFSPALLKPTLLAIAFASVALIGTWGSVQWIPLWVDKMTGGTQPHAKAASQIMSAVGAII